nr:hypothetical protein [Micromonospora sp. DSM 115978]
VSVVAQAAIGFAQYFTGVPVLLVELHVTGATIMWIFTLRLWLATVERPPVFPIAADTDESVSAPSAVAREIPAARPDSPALAAAGGSTTWEHGE